MDTAKQDLARSVQEQTSMEGGKKERVEDGLHSFLRTAPGRRGTFTQLHHGHCWVACPHGVGAEMASAGGEARYDHGHGPMTMDKPCGRPAHQSMIGSQATDWGAVASASHESK